MKSLIFNTLLIKMSLCDESDALFLWPTFPFSRTIRNHRRPKVIGPRMLLLGGEFFTTSVTVFPAQMRILLQAIHVQPRVLRKIPTLFAYSVKDVRDHSALTH